MTSRRYKVAYLSDATAPSGAGFYVLIEEFSFRGGGGSVSDQWSGAEVLGPYENQDLAEIAKFRAAGSERDPQRSG